MVGGQDQVDATVTDLFSRADRTDDAASFADLRRTVAAILQDNRAGLRLVSTDIAFLAVANHSFGEEQAASLSYARLTELYGEVLEQDRMTTSIREADVPRAINQLIDQRVLIEQAGARVLDDRRYALGPIGRAIANAYDVGHTLEAGRLTALLAGLQAELEGAIEEATRAIAEGRPWDLDRTWAVIGSLLADIDDRRVNLDYRQELLRAQIPEMMGLETWEDALARCGDVLRSSYQAAEEIKICLLEGHQRIQKRIDRLIGITQNAAPEIARLADNLDARLVLLADWASDRFGAWAGFHRHVMRFLTEMVRIDPHRTLARVLNEQVRAYAALMGEEGNDEHAFTYSLPICQAEPHRRVRAAEMPELGALAPVAFEVPVEEVLDPGPAAYRLAQIEQALENCLAATGEADLHGLLGRFADLPPRDLSLLAGRVVQRMLERARPEPVEAPANLAPLAPGLESELLRVVSPHEQAA
jgi:hypothetical protein